MTGRCAGPGRRRRITALAGCLAMTAGCRPTAGTHPSTGAPRTPFDARPYAEGRVPASTRIFLVAGGDDIANFAHEVVTQQRLWTDAGVAPAAIACYWAKPGPAAWRADRDQYDALQAPLDACRRAEPATLRADLLRVAAERPAWVYVFVTSHGLPPVLQWRAGTRDRHAVARKFDLPLADLAAIDQHAIGLQAGPGPRLEDAARIVADFRDGAALGDLMLSPGTLADTLAAFPATTLKIVVLQACFSGGFIGDTDQADDLSPVTRVPNVVLLTATAQDRPSFGCGAGMVSTYWGGALNKALARHLQNGQTPADVPWDTVGQDAAFVVDAMESIDGETPSLPGFFSNVHDAKIVH